MRRVVLAVVAAMTCAGSRAATRSDYLDMMEAAVSAYDAEELEALSAAARMKGAAAVKEHGFPRVAANLGVLIANGRRTDLVGICSNLLSASCASQRRRITRSSGTIGAEFSIKELVIAVTALESMERPVFPKAATDAWRADLSRPVPYEVYEPTMRVEVGKPSTRALNWAVFASASEQSRIRAGLDGHADYIETQVSDQLRYFDENGSFKDPGSPAFYDFVTRLQFAHLLFSGYDGPSRAKLLEQMEKSAEPTLLMLSACDEIPYGGRSNQFLHNHACYSSLCEWYAAHYKERDPALARRFRRAADDSYAGLRRWLELKPVNHVKNRFPRASDSSASAVGCEGYGYFAKYMVTLGSYAMQGWLYCDETIPLAPEAPRAPRLYRTSDDFHFLFAEAGDYSAQFDYHAAHLKDADPHYDAPGLGRVHRRGAPPPLCLSVPCPYRPNYRTDRLNPGELAILPVVPAPSWLMFVSGVVTGGAVRTDWEIAGLRWRCDLSDAGMEMEVSGAGSVGLNLPAFAFDGEKKTEIFAAEKELRIRYRGWECVYAVVSEGRIVDTDRTYCNRNGLYRGYVARGNRQVKVTIAIRKTGGSCGGVPPPPRNEVISFRADETPPLDKTKATAAEIAYARRRFLDTCGKAGQPGNPAWIGLARAAEAVGPGHAIPEVSAGVGEPFTLEICRGERRALQAVVMPKEGVPLSGVRASVGDLKDEKAALSAATFACAPVGCVAELDDVILGHQTEIDVAAGAVQGFWIQCDCPRDQRPGKYRGKVSVTGRTKDGRDFNLGLPFVIKVLTLTLPEKPSVPFVVPTLPRGVDAAQTKAFLAARRMSADDDGTRRLVPTPEVFMRDFVDVGLARLQGSQVWWRMPADYPTPLRACLLTGLVAGKFDPDGFLLPDASRLIAAGPAGRPLATVRLENLAAGLSDLACFGLYEEYAKRRFAVEPNVVTASGECTLGTRYYPVHRHILLRETFGKMPGKPVVRTVVSKGPVDWSKGKETVVRFARDIQDALDTAEEGDTVTLAPGTYLLEEPIVKSHDRAVRLRGGDADPRKTVLDGRGSFSPLFIEQPHLTVMGLTVTNGTMTASSRHGSYGGGIYLTAETTVTNCVVTSCRTGRADTTLIGGGIYARSPKTLVVDTLVEDCELRMTDGAGKHLNGAGIALDNGGTLVGVTVRNCRLVNAAKGKRQNQIHGAGLCALDATVRGCVFRDNLIDAGAGARSPQGGGVFLQKSGTVGDCLFAGNRLVVPPTRGKARPEDKDLAWHIPQGKPRIERCRFE